MPFVKCADCIRTKERNCSASHPNNLGSGCFCGATEGTKPEQPFTRAVSKPVLKAMVELIDKVLED